MPASLLDLPPAPRHAFCVQPARPRTPGYPPERAATNDFHRPHRAAPDRLGWLALIGGTTIIAWSGVLARFLDVGPLAGAAWRMGLAVPALAAWAKPMPARD